MYSKNDISYFNCRSSKTNIQRVPEDRVRYVKPLKYFSVPFCATANVLAKVLITIVELE